MADKQELDDLDVFLAEIRASPSFDEDDTARVQKAVDAHRSETESTRAVTKILDDRISLLQQWGGVIDFKSSSALRDLGDYFLNKHDDLSSLVASASRGGPQGAGAGAGT